MQKKWIVATAGGILLAGATLLFPQNTSWLTGTTDEKFETLAGIQPGLGVVMMEFGYRFGNIYYAAQASNWGMAAYQLKEMVEAQEVGETTRPARKAALISLENGALVPLANDIVNKDISKFNMDFAIGVATCNACHLGAGVPYIVFELPGQAEVPAKLDTGQTFTSDELRAILGDVLAP